MQNDAKTPLKSLKVDGGACSNNLLMQFQADILDTVVQRPKNTETTVMGAAYLAGICVGLWQQKEITTDKKIDKKFTPIMTSEKRERLYKRWLKAIERSKGWID